MHQMYVTAVAKKSLLKYIIITSLHDCFYDYDFFFCHNYILIIWRIMIKKEIVRL